MQTILKAGLCAGALMIGGSAAQAATITAIDATCDINIGTTFAVTADRCGGPGRDDANAVNLGAADGTFFSLGLQTGAVLGGLAVFEIAPGFRAPTSVFEVTNSNSDHWEAADVFVADDFIPGNPGTFTLVGRVDNGRGGTEVANTTLTFGGIWTYIAFQDASFDEYGVAGNLTEDGFDLDSFTVSPVPLPAGVLLLAGALFGMGAMRRRKAAAV